MRLLFHASARSMLSHTVTKQHPQHTIHTRCSSNIRKWMYSIMIKMMKWTVWLCSHYRHEHVFTRLICLFVKQMVSICLRGRLLLLLLWQRSN